MRSNKWQFFIDRGGTFTDVVALSPAGHIVSHKLLSENPQQYPDAIIQGIRDILRLKPQDSLPLDQIGAIKIGTTLSTNALLERKGVPVLLAITSGYADALRIGYQARPKIFDLNIILPTPLYQDVVEIPERINAQGEILKPLDIKVVTERLNRAYSCGFRSIAIVLMHGYRYNLHEKKLIEVAKTIGFTHISASHEIAPVMKLISRGDTTVLDAYLTPLLKDYIDRLRKSFGSVPLFFMQANGRVVSAHAFQGKNSILSGPAGGVIGMVETSLLAGFNQTIGFDMGGTSTDVSLFAGEYERTFSSSIGGVFLRIPMMAIHSIAAGGGSILHFDHQRYIVGPDSAGANPGPACYRCNGPLTITDCNVMLGKIQPEFFPKVFGLEGNQPLDVLIVRQKFAQLADKIKTETGVEHSLEQVAQGYLKVAVENIANAIKKISIQRAYDVTHYLLNCFGGAAPQHACAVADALGINKILIHPLAGVLSAYGIGLAEMGIIRERAIEKFLNNDITLFLDEQFEELTSEVESELTKQIEIHETIIISKKVHLRYDESDTTLMVEYDKPKIMKEKFASEHSKRFGFISPKKKIVIEAISVEATTKSEKIEDEEVRDGVALPNDKIPVKGTVEMFTQNKFHKTFIYMRQDLLPCNQIKGPAIISDAHATTVVEPGWEAQITSTGQLLLSRCEQLAFQTSTCTAFDPVLLEVFNNRFMNIAEQMGIVLRNTASSVNIKERLDFSCALFDKYGELVANAPHIPVHLGSMSESVKSIVAQNGKQMRPGDAYVLNSPYHGGTHLPDMTIVSPVFDTTGKTLLFLVGSRGHHADIGGITPGSIPAQSKRIEEEGVLINNFQIMSQRHFNEEEVIKLLTHTTYPVRNVRQNIEDLKAQIAANENGSQMLLDLVAQYSTEVVQAYMNHVRKNARISVEKLLRKLHEGQFDYSLDDGSKIKVAIRIDQKKKRVCIDFTGSAGQHPGNFNAPTAVCKAAVIYVLRCMVAEDIPLNSGSLDPIDIIIPEHSMLNPQYPAAVVAGNVETSQCIVDTLLGALQIVAASQGTCNNLTFGNDQYQYYETICGGAGAGPNFNGASCVHTHMTNTNLTDPEILEWRFPVLLEEFSRRSGSGGEGEYKGGDGVIRRLRFLTSMTINIVSSHRKIPPYGLKGGKPGKTGHNWVLRVDGKIEKLPGSARIEVNPGDVVVIETPGGGGYGKIKN